MFRVFVAILCLVSLSHSAPLACEDLVQPVAQLDPHWQGRWALAAGSANDSATGDALIRRLSLSIDLTNSSYTQAYRDEGKCQYYSHNISIEDNTLRIYVEKFNFTGTFFKTSCPDCLLLRLNMKAPEYDSSDLYLFSRNRVVEQKHIDDFRAQAECMKLLPPVIMDPTLELCPEQSGSEPAAKTDGA